MRPLSTSTAFLVLAVILLVITAYRAWVSTSSGLNLYVDEAQYWYWARHLDWGFYSKPPMIAGIIAATTAVCGDTESCVRAGSLLLYPASTLLLFLLARRLFDARTALWAGILFITLPAVSLSSLLISTDVALFFFWTLALYAWVRVLETDAWADWLLLGVAIGFGMLSKYTMGIFFVSALLHLLISGRQRYLLQPRPWVAVLLAVLIFSPNLWWNWKHGFPTFQHTAEIAEGGKGLHWGELTEFLFGQLGVFGLLLFPLFVWVVFKGRVLHKRLLLSFALPFLLIILLQALLGRANANWAAPAYVAATLLLATWLQGRTKLLVLALLLNLGLGLTVYHYATLTRMLGVEMNRKTDIQKRLKGWDGIGRQYLFLQRQYPRATLLADSRDVLSALAYYARPAGLRGVSWNPQHLLRHHYDLVTTLDGKTGQDFLFVSSDVTLEAVKPYFEQVEKIGRLHVAIHPDYQLDYPVYWLHTFKGLDTR